MRKRASDSYDAIFKVERSFRLLFRDEEEIEFFADTDEDKTKWLVRSLICMLDYHIAHSLTTLYLQVAYLPLTRWENSPQSLVGRTCLAEAAGSDSC